MRGLSRVALPLLLALAAAPSLVLPAEARVQSATKVCPGVGHAEVMHMPPAGFVSVVDTQITANCTVMSSGPRLVPRAQFLATLAAGERLTTLAIATPTAPSAAPMARKPKPGASDPTMTMHQRLWDCCGILLNEFDTTLSWSYDGSQVYNVGGYSSYYAHPEPSPNVGWWLNNWSTYYINGCSGCSYIELAGYGDFKYDGEFDHNGNYENEYWNYDTGYANGTNGYYYRWYFKNTFFGWHKQDWCC